MKINVLHVLHDCKFCWLNFLFLIGPSHLQKVLCHLWGWTKTQPCYSRMVLRWNVCFKIEKNNAITLIFFYRYSYRFGFNLALICTSVFLKKSQIARATSVSAIWDFWKTRECKLIPYWTRKTVWLLINNIHGKICRGFEWPEVFEDFRKCSQSFWSRSKIFSSSLATLVC